MAWTTDDISVRVLDKHEAVIRDVLSARFPQIRFIDSAKEARGLKVLMSFRPPEDEPVAAYDWVHSVGAGVDHLCAALDGPDNAPIITRTTGRMGQQIGEYCVAYSLAHLQRFADRAARQAEHRWDKQASEPRYMFETSVAIVGTGSIGSGIARGFAALGARVTGNSMSGRAKDDFDAVHRLADFSAQPAPDILCLALPATDETEGVIGADILNELSGALLINVGRGSTLDHEALRAALSDGTVAHAALDVFETEPLPADDWRWSHPQVTVTSHVSGLTLPDDAANEFCALLARFIETGTPPESVDIERGY